MATDTDLIAKMVAVWQDETDETETEAMTRVLAVVREHDKARVETAECRCGHQASSCVVAHPELLEMT